MLCWVGKWILLGWVELGWEMDCEMGWVGMNLVGKWIGKWVGLGWDELSWEMCWVGMR